MMTRKNGMTTDRNPDVAFSTGNPGQSKGARHKTTLGVANFAWRLIRAWS